MRAVVALMIKDFIVLRKSLLFLGVFLAGAAAVSRGAGAMALVAIAAVVFMLVSFAFAFEEIGGSGKMIASLPVGRLHIPAARYLEILVGGAAGFLVFAVFAAIFSFLPPIPAHLAVPRMPPGAIAMIGLLPASLGMAVMMPLWYRFGYTKTRFASVAVIMLVAFIGPMAGKASEWDTSGRALESFAALSQPWLVIATVGIAAAALAASCAVSMRIYAKKEF